MFALKSNFLLDTSVGSEISSIHENQKNSLINYLGSYA